MALHTDSNSDMKDDLLTMAILTAGGWALSLSEIETIARIASLVVPTLLSVIIFFKRKKKKDDN